MDNIERVDGGLSDTMMKSARRVSRRYTYEAEISHDVVLPDIFYDGKIYNYSNEGVYFESNEPLLPGDEISITIKKIPPDVDANAEKTFDVGILWRKDLHKTTFQYGYGAKLLKTRGVLIKLFGADQRKKIDSKDNDRKELIEAISDKDPRKHPRKICNEITKFVYRNHICKGLATNIGLGGAFIKTDTKLPHGEKITLIITGKESRKDIKLNGWIVRKDESGFGFKIDLSSSRKR